MTRSAAVPGLICAALALAACDSKTREFFEPIADPGGLSTGDVTGIVTVDGVALPGVRVELGPPADLDAMTDTQGRFSFESLEPGSYPVALADIPPGVACPEIAVSVMVVAGEVATAEFGCAAVGGLQVNVLLNGLALAGAEVSVDGAESRQATTLSSGPLGLADLPVGSYTVSLGSLPSGIACGSYSQQVMVQQAGMTTATFDCTSLGGVAGTVRLDGTPYAAVDVDLDGAIAADTTTDGGGSFSFSDVPAGTYSVSLPALPANVTCTDATIQVQILAGEIASADFDCVSAAPPSFDDLMGDYDVDYVPTLTTCEASIVGFSVVGTARPDSTVSPPGVDFSLPHTPHPIWGYYDSHTGIFVADFMWHEDSPGVEWNEFWDVLVYVNREGRIAFLGSAIVLFRDETTGGELCRREYDLSGIKRP